MVSQKVVTPVKTGVQKPLQLIEKTGFSDESENDKKWCFLTFYEFINFVRQFYYRLLDGVYPSEIY
ncbi:MAG: hypothetical protein B1H11_12275 [Desulfobacteraceae bacterium 4484_190.1]|nr:MAG: hypothetical protein B1H11_12275 [Desulfobacteraceae bacterium 4484_190.1]